jgi:hypothetical protein
MQNKDYTFIVSQKPVSGLQFSQNDYQYWYWNVSKHRQRHLLTYYFMSILALIETKIAFIILSINKTF